MRRAFADELRVQAESKNVILVTGDLGYGVFEEYESKLPHKFINAGITEQSMTSLAAGLADQGFIPILYSIANFPSFRNFEQIRNDLAYPARHAIICSVGAGLSYGALGNSHFAIEDVGALRTLPNLRILAPSGPQATRLALQSSIEAAIPTYLRLGKTGEVDFIPTRHTFEPFVEVTQGNSSIAIVSTGPIGATVSTVNVALTVPFRHYSVEQIWPIEERLVTQLSHFDLALVVEEHVQAGGLFSILSERFQLLGVKTQLRSLAVDPKKLKLAGSHDFMRLQVGLDVESIENSLRNLNDGIR